jgi:hypothetical protein
MDFKEVVWGPWTNRSGLEQRQMAGTCKCGNKLLVSIKSGDFLDQLITG